MSETRLEEIRENWRVDDLEWDDIRTEGDKDIQCLTGNLWQAMAPEGYKQRKDANRPIIELDELNQYCNQVINDLRANKRGIKVSPRGNGANDKTALYRQGRIRDIEYRSNSHQAYTTLAENMIQRGYAFARIKAEYISDQSFTQELLIDPIVNPNTITPDAYSVRSDGKDLRRLWVRESRTIEEFKREFPKATIQSFTAEHMATAKQWVKGQTIDIAECWEKRYAKSRTLLALKPTDPSQPPQMVWKDTLKGTDIPSERILKSREVDQFTVKKTLTNGLEILEEMDWPTQAIPFITAYGKVVYVTEGGQTKRKMLSLVRLARSPQMLMAYLATCEAELVGMTPKFPYFFYEGSLSANALELLAKSLHEPVAGIPVKHLQLGGGTNPNPFPTRQPYEPPIQALEFLKESVRRSIQAAIGSSPLPTDAQRHNDKSGIALKKIEDTAQKGSFHFADHYDEAIARTGELLNALIPHFDDTARDVSIRKPDDSVAMVRINDPSQGAHIQANQEAGFDGHVDPAAGDHDVTISVGPRADSEREAQTDFITQLVQSKVPEMLGPQKGPEVIAQGIRALSLGPMVEAIADIISPKDQNDPAAAAQQVGQLKQQLQHVTQAAQQMQEELKTGQADRESKERIEKAKIDSAERIATMEAQRRAETAIAVAEIGSKSKDAALFMDERARIGVQGVDAATTAVEHAHEIGMAQLEHQQAIQQGQQQHENALAQGDQATAGAMATQQQAADLAPEPTAGQ